MQLSGESGAMVDIRSVLEAGPRNASESRCTGDPAIGRTQTSRNAILGPVESSTTRSSAITATRQISTRTELRAWFR